MTANEADRVPSSGTHVPVRRYDIYMHSDEIQFLRECKDGDYVKATDYDALAADNARLKAEVEALQTAVQTALHEDCNDPFRVLRASTTPSLPDTKERG